jgi:hypothetical protein
MIKRTKSRKQSGPAGGRSRGSRPDTRERAFQVLGDMNRDASLTFTRAAQNRNIDPRSIRGQIPSAFRKASSGHIKARPSDRYRQTLHIPSDRPEVRIPVPTKNSVERQLLGKWLDALNAAGRGDFSKLKKFPRGQVVGGVPLPTDPLQVQPILRAISEHESPYEGLYRSLARPS